MLDEIKQLHDDIADEAEVIRKGDFDPIKDEEHGEKKDELIPSHETDGDEMPDEIPKKLLGRYQIVGRCKCCEASVYVEEYNASEVVRPKLIYTCDAEFCWASFDERDVHWTPKYFKGTGLIDPKGFVV